MPKSKYILPLVVVGGGLWWLSTRNRVGNGANGGTFPYTPSNGNGGLDPATSMATVAGSLGGVELASHRVAKDKGEGISVLVDWRNDTTDFAGNGIPWNFRFRVELGHSTGWGGVGGWDNMNDLLAGSTKGQQWRIVEGENFGAHQTVFNALEMGNELDEGQEWDIRVTMDGAVSDAQGNPTDQWIEIAVGSHEAAVEYQRSWGAASWGGSIGNIEVQQEGLAMRKLGLRAQRPPWGMSAGARDTTFPITNRNMTLPGVSVRVRQEVSARGVGSPIGPGRRVYAV
jgi:hypothetical protein